MNKAILTLKSKYSKYLIWVFVLSAISLNVIFTIVTNTNLKIKMFDSLFRLLLSPFDNIRYGHYIAQKFFLVTISFITFIWWLKSQKISFKKFIKKNILPVGIIALASLITHCATYGGWFWMDDYRIILHYFGSATNLQQLPGFTTMYYPLGIFLLVIRWFGHNYALYNSLGILMIFSIGTAIFFIFNKLQKRWVLSLLLALFFITTPTYYRISWEIIEWIGDTFSLFLFAISIYMLVSKNWPGVLIFAAASLEFGLAKTHYIALPLILMAAFFTEKGKILSKDFLIKIGLLGSLTLVYIPVFLGRNGIPHGANILAVAGSILSVMVPHGIINPIAKLLMYMKFTNIYTIPFMGISIILFLLVLTILFFFRKRTMSAKLIIIGLSITISSTIFPIIYGTQANRNVSKILEYFTNQLPYTTTMYGLPSSFGLIFIIAGLALAMRFNLFKKIIIILILLNTFTLIRSYSIWNKSYGYPHRKINSQLLNLLTADGLEKYIYIPPQSGSLWYETKDFQNIFRAKEKYNLFTNTPSKFIESITKNNPPPNQIYFMTMDKNYNITDFSEKIRINYPKEITLQKIDEIPRFK